MATLPSYRAPPRASLPQRWREPRSPRRARGQIQSSVSIRSEASRQRLEPLHGARVCVCVCACARAQALVYECVVTLRIIVGTTRVEVQTECVDRAALHCFGSSLHILSAGKTKIVDAHEYDRRSAKMNG